MLTHITAVVTAVFTFAVLGPVQQVREALGATLRLVRTLAGYEPVMLTLVAVGLFALARMVAPRTEAYGNSRRTARHAMPAHAGRSAKSAATSEPIAVDAKAA
jgi:hypothetical protein